jgi:hypothetical protein
MSLQDQLRQPAILGMLATTMQQLAQQPPATSLSGAQALWGAANLTLLVAGHYTSLTLQQPGSGKPGSGGQVVHVLNEVPHLSRHEAAFPYCHAACVFLKAATSVTCLGPSSPDLESAAGAAASLWPLAQRTWIRTLFSSMQGTPGGFELACALYVQGLQVLPPLCQSSVPPLRHKVLLQVSALHRAQC